MTHRNHKGQAMLKNVTFEEILERLTQYEDIELYPSEIKKLQKENTELKTKLVINKEFMTREDYLEIIDIAEKERNKYKKENIELKARLEKQVVKKPNENNCCQTNI